ncbi:hypothetical protein [Aequorivita nionensis]|uniref:hypothetical protein n=1 Tax=Aequorivita nionensis TaxID=1287690 RepID=UPI00396596FC
MKTIFLLTFGLTTIGGMGQSIIKDSKGNSSIGLTPGFKETKKAKKEDSPKIDTISFNLGIVTFTTKDKKLGLDYYSYFTPEKFTDYYIGLSTNSKLKNSTANIFSSGNIVAEGELKLSLGFRLFKNKTDWTSLLAGKKTNEEIQDVLDNSTLPANDLWLTIDGSFTGSSFKRFEPDNSFSNQIIKETFTGYNINIGFNYWNARIINNTILGGATIGIKQKNNFDDLTESIREENVLQSDSTTNTSRKITTKETVYTGAYKESIVFPLNIDLYFVPHNLKNIGLLVFSRTDVSRDEKPKTNLGLGFFFLKDQNAFNPIAGLTFGYSDIFDVDESDDAKGDLNKFILSITTRINLVNNQKRK